MKMFAYWEKNDIGWGLVVFHDDMPSKPSGGDPPPRQGPFIVTPDMIDDHGNPIMGRIKNAFPLNQGEE